MIPSDPYLRRNTASFRSLLALLALWLMPVVAHANPTVKLFDGESLAGWHTVEGTMWRVENGEIVGGTLDAYVRKNSYLVTDNQYQDFELSLKIKLTGTAGFINSGIQVRSTDVRGFDGMVGYQVDVGDDWWGKLYDEGRRHTVIAVSVDMNAIGKAVDSEGWNLYRIRCVGGRLQSWINGVPALDYEEDDKGILQSGNIGIQIHGGGKAQVRVKDITLTVID